MIKKEIELLVDANYKEMAYSKGSEERQKEYLRGVITHFYHKGVADGKQQLNLAAFEKGYDEAVETMQTFLGAEMT